SPSPLPIVRPSPPPDDPHGPAGEGSLMLWLRCRERCLLLRRRLFLVFFAPFVVGHAVDDLARLGVAERGALPLRRLAIPAREAIAAEPGEVHQIDVLHVRALAQMCDERAECPGFEFGAGLVV